MSINWRPVSYTVLQQLRGVCVPLNSCYIIPRLLEKLQVLACMWLLVSIHILQVLVEGYSHLTPLRQPKDIQAQEWVCSVALTLPVQTTDCLQFLLDMNIPATLEVTGASRDILHMTHMLGAFSWDIIMVLTGPAHGIHHTTTMTAFTHVNFLTAMGMTCMKTLGFTIQTGAVSKE